METQRYEPKNPIRVVTAASLFDGHDASINIMRRILQSTGAEVIHLGHNRSANDIVTAAVHEKAQAIAISSYQGGHTEFFKYTIDLLKELGSDSVRVFGGGGGTITPEEADELHKYGVARIYSPEDGRQLGLQGIINHILKTSDTHPLENIDWKQLGSFSKNNRSLAHALTCLEAGEAAFEKGAPYAKFQSDFKSLKKNIAGASTSGTVVGITGTGGAGKSSLTDEFVLRLLNQQPEAKLAVLAIDPTRAKTGGALLGDRLRMNSLSHKNCYMRSLATRQKDRSISGITQEAVALLKAAGFDWIFVETGGIGQSETPLVDLVDFHIYVMTAEYGASTQLEKINMLDYADLVIINKFEKGGSLDALTDVRKQFRRNHLDFEAHPAETYPVIGTVASRFGDAGVDAALSHILHCQSSENKRQCLQSPFSTDTLDTRSIVPRERADYLASIAKTVRDYKSRVETGADALSKADGLKSALERNDLSKSTKEELKAAAAEAERKLDSEMLDSLKEYESTKTAYSGDELSYQVRDKTITVPLTHESLSHNKIPRIALPRFNNRAELLKFLMLENLPGFFPYTAGVFPLKRQGEDPKRMFAGEGTPKRTNERFHFLCQNEPSKRLSTAFDSVTLYGEDPATRPDIFGKIGESGVSVCSLEDAQILYDGFDLCDPAVSVSMTINGPAPMLLAFYFNTAIEQQVAKFEKDNKRAPTEDERDKIAKDALKRVRGTVQADILKEDQAQNTCIFSTEFALRMMGDIQEYFVQNEIRNFYSVSISGYHIAEAGANPITQLALTLANGFTYVEYYKARGMAMDTFAPNLSFFFSNGMDAEYTVIGRVARRIWSIAMKHLYGGNSRSQKLKYHVQTSGRSLHAQEISFNDIRTTLQALLAYTDQCNSLHTNAYDEAITTPTAESVRRAMAIQLIIAREFGFNKNENPWQGSFFVEELTELVEEAVLKEFENLSRRGGVLGSMEHQYQRNKIQEESLHYERQKHSGELPIIGVNTYVNPEADYKDQFPTELTRASYEEKNAQIEALKRFQEKHSDKSLAALDNLKKVAVSGGNLFAALMECARVCSLGQMTRALYSVGGEYRRSA